MERADCFIVPIRGLYEFVHHAPAGANHRASYIHTRQLTPIFAQMEPIPVRLACKRANYRQSFTAAVDKQTSDIQLTDPAYVEVFGATGRNRAMVT